MLAWQTGIGARTNGFGGTNTLEQFSAVLSQPTRVRGAAAVKRR